jgi:ABC-2 type transport system permease protein
MGPVLSLAKKDLRLLCRDRMDLFFTLVFPLFVGIFFGIIFGGSGEGGGSKMGIAVVDEDRTPTSQAFIARLEAADELDVLRTKDRAPLTRAQADDLVRKGDKVASVVIPQGYSAAADNMFRGEPIRIEGTIDPSRRAESGMLQGILTKYAFQGMAQMFGDSTKMQAMARKNLADIRASKDMDPVMKAALESFLPTWRSSSPMPTSPATRGRPHPRWPAGSRSRSSSRSSRRRRRRTCPRAASPGASRRP